MVNDCIRQSIDFGHMVVSTYLSDFSDADLLVRPMEGMNHAAWQLGHLISADHEFMTKIGCPVPELPAGFADQHDLEHSKSDDVSGFLTKDEYFALWEQIREAVFTALKAMPEADFNKPTPESMHGYAPTVGAVFRMVGGHELMHAGQFVAIRRKLDKPILI